MYRSGTHDVGGVEDVEPTLDLKEKPYAFWERQVHGTAVLLVKKGLLNLDELRRGQEGLPAEAYNTLTYYEKWAASMVATSLERGTITQHDLDKHLGPALEQNPPVR